MPRVIRVPLTQLVEGDHWLDAEAAHYLTRVHRLGVGDPFVAFDPSLRLEAGGRILELVGRRARGRLSAPRPARLVSPLAITLLQGMGKGTKVDQVVRDATELGARRVIAVLTERTVVRSARDVRDKSGRWRAIALQAARQSGRGDVPEVDGPCSLATAVAELGSSGPRLLLDGVAPRCLAASLEAWLPTTPIALLVGPEGGLSPADRSIVEDAGFVAVSLGPFTLRTETAGSAALGALLAASRLVGIDPSPEPYL